MAKLGDQLLNPEAGWQRISITSDVITKSTPGTAVNGYWYWVVDNNLKIQFNFKGSKLRIIAPTYYDRVVMRVMIDGKEYFSLGQNIEQYVIILFEKTLAKREHCVQITPVMGVGTYLTINGFDIDATGEILPYREINNYHIYLKDGLGYGVQDRTFIKLTDSWGSLTPADKKALLLSTNCEIASATDLVNLGKIKEIIYSEIEEKQSVLVRAVPKDQLVMPRGLISLDSFKGIDKATLTSTLKSAIITNMRFNEAGIYDQSGNTWINMSGVTFDGDGRFGGKAAKFSGSNYLKSNNDINFAAEEFTISFHVKADPLCVPWSGMLGTYVGNLIVLYARARSDANVAMSIASVGDLQSSISILDNQWHHIAVTRVKGKTQDTIKMYVDGAVAISANILTTQNIDYAPSKMNIGSDAVYGSLIGMLDDICIIKGKAYWTENFTPPTNYLLVSKNQTCIKLLVTNDLATYQTYDFTAQEWKVVDHTDLAAVKANGIDTAVLQNIDRAAWDKLLRGKSGIGFAYLMGIDAIADQCAIDQLTLQADMKGIWK